MEIFSIACRGHAVYSGMLLAIQKQRRNEGEAVYQVHSLSINVAFACFKQDFVMHDNDND